MGRIDQVEENEESRFLREGGLGIGRVEGVAYLVHRFDRRRRLLSIARCRDATMDGREASREVLDESNEEMLS
jgi:hypothetical protein